MIPRTANVAIPAASPESRISGKPTSSAKTPPTRGRDEKRRHVPDRRRAQEVEEVRHRRGLLRLGDREHARRPDADREEADVPEREHAGVADEDVDRDDRRDGDERRDEVDLGRRRDEGAEDPGGDDEQHRRQELDGCATGSHTRSTRPRLRVKSPSGRMRSTRMTSPKRNEGRYWLWLDGSAPPSRPDT